MSTFPKNIWVVSREYAGIAEAGGVKNVACSLCEGLSRTGVNVTLFIPRYACTDFYSITNYKPNCIPPQKLRVGENLYTVSFDSGLAQSNVHVVFVVHQIFADKTGVYTYTAQDEKTNPDWRKGIGFSDELLLDVLFQKAVVSYGNNTENPPDIVHCQDAATALVPAFFHFESEKTRNKVKFAVTIHNAGPGYHHNFHSLNQAEFLTSLPTEFLCRCMNGEHIEPFLAAAHFSSITTVSPWYAKELVNPENNEDTAGLSSLFAEKQVNITGITNGIDCERYNPNNTTLSKLPYAFDSIAGDFKGKYMNREFFLSEYSAQTSRFQREEIQRYGFLDVRGKKTIYIGYHGRIVRQKGIDILVSAAENLLEQRDDVCFILTGQGESHLESDVVRLTEKHPGKCIFFCGYDRTIARLTTAISDFIVLPSKFEPCGLEDFIAQLYGTVPVAHATGGLNKIIDNVTGFLYKNNSPSELSSLLDSLCTKISKEPRSFRNMAQHSACYVTEKYSWDSVIQNEYLPFYQKI